MDKRYIGLFFYINGQLKALKIEVDSGVTSGDFVNHPKSHFDFFLEINANPYDDYGHYPRGRVIYNKTKNIFLIYVDKVIFKNKTIINEIKKEYNLVNERVRVMSDSHYTHDNLI